MGATCGNDYKALRYNSSDLSGSGHYLSNFPLSLAIFAVFPLHLESFMSHPPCLLSGIFALKMYGNLHDLIRIFQTKWFFSLRHGCFAVCIGYGWPN